MDVTPDQFDENSGAGGHREMLDDRSERERREEGQAADDQDHADDQADEQAAGGRERAGRWRNRFLLRERAGDRHGRDDHPEAADEHRDGAGDVVEERVAGEAREGRAVVAGLRGVGVEHLGEAVRPGIGHRGDRRRDRPRRPPSSRDTSAAGSGWRASPS